MRRLCALGLAALVLAGCGTAGAGTQSVTITGKNLTIYVSAPTGYQSDPQLADTLAAEQLAYAQHHGEVTDYTLQLRTITATKLSGNARTAIQNTKAIAYLGELAPGASEASAGITNAQDLLQVSPTDTALELTQATAAVPKSPKYFYESWSTYGRTFARVVPSSAIEAKAQVSEMHSLGVTKLYVGDDGSDYGKAIALAVKQDAGAASITISPSPTGADGVFFGSVSATAAARTFASALAANPNVKLFGPSALDTPAFINAIGSAQHVYISTPGLPSSQLPAAGQQFVTAFQAQYHHAPASQAIFGYEAMSAVLDSIHAAGKSANDRAQVVHNFFSIKNRANSVLGPYSITAGDSSLTGFVFEQLKAGSLKPFKAVSG